METIRALQTFAPALNDLMFAITSLGSERAYIVLLLISYLAIDARVGRYLGVALLSSFYLNFMLKGIIDTPRPFRLEPGLSLGEVYDATGIGAGFPSGHAQASTTFWGLAALYVRKSWFWALAVLLVGLISVSRLYFALHLPIDVIGGALIGIVFLALAYRVFRWTEGRTFSQGVILVLGIAVPFVVHLSVPHFFPHLTFAESDLLMGGLAAFLTGPTLYPYRVPGALWRRVLLAVLGIVLVFAFLLGSSLLLPEAVKRNAVVGFLRYLTLGYMGVVVAPWLGRQLRLVTRNAAAQAHP